MIIIPNHKLVLLLPWKTGSQTLQSRLAHLNQSPYSPFFDFNAHLGCVVHQHLMLSQFLALPEGRSGYRLAVFVRNPYDRVVSGFFQIARDILVQPKLDFPQPWIKDLVIRQLEEQRQSLERANGDLNQWFENLSEDKILCGGRNTSLPLHPCHYWTHLAGQPVAQFIGRVENFEADFSRLCDEFGLAVNRKTVLNVSSEAMRQPDINGYNYTKKLSDRTISKINQLFRHDFKLFGYNRL